VRRGVPRCVGAWVQVRGLEQSELVA
jgi:hypothetical protein